jgi:hypothetical protein
LVPCARNKWGNWWDFWFYVSEGAIEDHPGLPRGRYVLALLRSMPTV